MYELQSTFGRDNSFSGLKCRSREIIYFDSFANGDLPFIPAEEIEQRNGRNDSALWIVIDNVVYDCSTFVRQHPGGDTVIRSFAGKDCSWQYHKIHDLRGDKSKQSLLRLRVGKTAGVQNPYAQPDRPQFRTIGCI